MNARKATISLLLPTRGRPAEVRRLFASLKETTSRPERIEVVLYLDEDDEESHDFEDPFFRVVKLIRPRATMGFMTCECYEASGGRYLMLANDDIVFRTRGWDEAIGEAFCSFPDEIAVVWADDLIHGPVFPTLPFISRSFCELAGGPCPTAYIHDYIDVHLFDIFRNLDSFGFNRLVYLPHVVIEHKRGDRELSCGGRSDCRYHSQADLNTYILLVDERRRIASALARAIRAGSQAAAEGVAAAEEAFEKKGPRRYDA